MREVLRAVLVCALLFGCNESHDGHDDAGPMVDSAVTCDPCADAVSLRITGVADPADITVEGADVQCVVAGELIYCGIRTLPPGSYALTVSAPGTSPETVFFDVGEPVTIDGCTCPTTFSRTITLRPM